MPGFSGRFVGFGAGAFVGAAAALGAGPPPDVSAAPAPADPLPVASSGGDADGDALGSLDGGRSDRPVGWTTDAGSVELQAAQTSSSPAASRLTVSPSS
jgi:hypothetical protein